MRGIEFTVEASVHSAQRSGQGVSRNLARLPAKSKLKACTPHCVWLLSTKFMRKPKEVSKLLPDGKCWEH